MRIAYLIGQYPAINHHYLLVEIRILRQLGWQVEVASISAPDRPIAQLEPEEQAEAARTWCVKRTPKGQVLKEVLLACVTRPAGALRSAAAAWRFGRTQRARRWYAALYWVEALLVGRWLERQRIAHVHVSFSGTVGWLVSQAFPVSWSLGVYGFGELYDPAGTALAEKIASCRFVRAISRHSCNELMLASARSDWGKLLYAPLGIEPADFPYRPAPHNQTLHLVSVGRLSPEKGQFLLLAALAALGAERLSFQLHLVGSGPDQEALAAEARRLGLGETVIFEGRTPQKRLMEIYAEADIFVLTSLSEGIPIVLMEAMSMGIPCIAPRITGIPELIEDGRDGLLYTPADGDGLAAALRRLMEDRELRLRLAANAHQKAITQYDLERNSRTYAALLEKWLGERSASVE